MSFSRRLVSDHGSSALGIASVEDERKKRINQSRSAVAKMTSGQDVRPKEGPTGRRCSGNRKSRRGYRSCPYHPIELEDLISLSITVQAQIGLEVTRFVGMVKRDLPRAV